MLKKCLKLFSRASFLAVIILLASFYISPRLTAISDPSHISWGAGSPTNQYQVFNNVSQTGDWLICAESYVTTNDTTASTAAYSFSFMNTANTTVYRSVALWSYGDRPISIYISAADATTLGLTVNSAYILKLGINPTIGTPSGSNTIYTALNAGNYSDESTKTSSLDPLKLFCIQMGQHMQSVDAVTTYLINVGSTSYVTSVGAPLFLTGIPNLDLMCPSLFQTYVAPITVPVSTNNMSYPSNNITIGGIFGTNANTGITNLAAWFGMPNSSGAKAIILMGLGAVLLFIISRKVQDRSMLLIFGVLIFLFFVWTGIGSWGMMLMIAIVVAILFFYYFWSRGIL